MKITRHSLALLAGIRSFFALLSSWWLQCPVALGSTGPYVQPLVSPCCISWSLGRCHSVPRSRNCLYVSESPWEQQGEPHPQTCFLRAQQTCLSGDVMAVRNLAPGEFPREPVRDTAQLRVIKHRAAHDCSVRPATEVT